MLASPENTDDLGESTPSSSVDEEEVQLRRQALHDVRWVQGGMPALRGVDPFGARLRYSWATTFTFFVGTFAFF